MFGRNLSSSTKGQVLPRPSTPPHDAKTLLTSQFERSNQFAVPRQLSLWQHARPTSIGTMCVAQLGEVRESAIHGYRRNAVQGGHRLDLRRAFRAFLW